MRYWMFLFFVLVLSGIGWGQKDRYRFAMTYVGLEGNWLQSVGATPEIRLPDFVATRVTIGGTHFWNNADFYVSFPLFSSQISGDQNWSYSDGIITGGRVLPLGLSKKNPTPFLGLQWIVPRFSQKGGPDKTRSKLGLEAGITQVVAKSWTVELGTHYIVKQQHQYYTGRNSSQNVQPPNLGIGLAIKKYFDFTRGLSSEKAQSYITKVRDTLSHSGGLNTWSIGLGISSTIGLGPISFAADYPFVPQCMGIAIHPDVALGYYLYEPDMAFRFAFRLARTRQSAYEVLLDHRQQHLSFEGFKFLFDYKGFVPFVGLSLGATHHRFQATDAGQSVGATDSWLGHYGLTFGWDIRPTDVEWLILRTSLRYYPPANLKVNSKRVTNSQLEFNFIQAVIYPVRLSRHNKIN